MTFRKTRYWLFLLGAGLYAGFLLSVLFFWPKRLPASDQGILVTIARGSSPRNIARLLKESKVIDSERGFLATARMLGWSKKLKAGRYHFKGYVNHFTVAHDLAGGKTLLEKITFPEGIRASKIAGMLRSQMGLDSAETMQLVENRVWFASLGVEAQSLEGYLYPDTYFFETNQTAENILVKMVQHFHEVVTDTLVRQAKDQGWSLHELVTLASLVEGEAVLNAERPVIAGIYINRLRKRIALDACPTIQYLLPDGPRRLLDRDLKIESPYNTYLHPGLPPGPVNNPGICSILAVLNPAPVQYLYLVANGDGSHTFSSTLDDHNAAKRRFNRVRRQVIRQSF